MLSRSVLRTSRQLPYHYRALSTSPLRMAEGDTGAPRAAAQADAFSKREKSNEDQYVRQQELEKLKALREKLQAQRSSIGELIDNIDSVTKDEQEKK